MMQVCEFCDIAFNSIRCPLCEETEALNVALKERDELREKVDSLEADRLHGGHSYPPLKGNYII